VREAIEQKTYDEVDVQVTRLAAALDREADLIDALWRTLEGRAR
jgi:hypothetical protein